MSGPVECPKCGVDISDTYEPADPSVGIMTGGWYCDACDETIAEWEIDNESDYDPRESK